MLILLNTTMKLKVFIGTLGERHNIKERETERGVEKSVTFKREIVRSGVGDASVRFAAC